MATLEDLIARKRARINEVHQLDPKRTALLVIDMQRGFMDPDASMLVPTAWDVVPAIRKMMHFCRGVKIPLVFTEFVAAPEVPSLREDPFGPEHLTAGPGEPTGWGYRSGNCILGTQGPESPDTIDELKPLPGELVVKGFSVDKFYGTNLDLALRGQDIRYLIITGIMADICVNATLLSATIREYRVTALTDCITTIWPNILEAVFDIWGRKFARLMTSDQVIKELEEQLPRRRVSAQVDVLRST
jgi:nicotinamidase-related amidase